MKATEGSIGRVFVLRLEDGDIIPQCIEEFAREKNISHAQVQLLGGINEGDIVVGPRKSDQLPPMKMLLPIEGAHEIVGVGLIAEDDSGNPILHLHGALGRSGHTITGCLREGVRTWLVGEAIIVELLGVDAKRTLDESSGFKLLKVVDS